MTDATTTPTASPRRIVDPHHHLWPEGGALPYGPAEFRADLDTVPAVERTVFIECGAGYRTDGPAHLRPVGETEFVAGASAAMGGVIGGIVAHADLADSAHLEEVLDAHAEAGQGLLRGVRDAAAWDPHPEALTIPGRSGPGRYEDPAFRRGLVALGRRGLTYDAWHYHHQMAAFTEVARAAPDTVLVLDHFGTPLGVGAYADRRQDIFERWTRDLAELARCENVVAKLGGLAMPDNGWGWHAGPPPAAEEVVAAHGPWYRHTIETFGPRRCMFESNFPVDRFSFPYAVYWEVAAQVAAPYAADEQAALFSGTAGRVYRLG